MRIRHTFQSLNRDQPLCNYQKLGILKINEMVSIAQSRPAPLQPPCEGPTSVGSIGFNRSIATSPSATAREGLLRLPPGVVSIAQSRPAPLQLGMDRTARIQLYPSFNRSIATSPSATWTLFPQSRVNGNGFNRSIATSPSATARSKNPCAFLVPFQSLNRDQPLCNIIMC